MAAGVAADSAGAAAAPLLTAANWTPEAAAHARSSGRAESGATRTTGSTPTSGDDASTSTEPVHVASVYTSAEPSAAVSDARARALDDHARGERGAPPGVASARRDGDGAHSDDGAAARPEGDDCCPAHGGGSALLTSADVEPPSAGRSRSRPARCISSATRDPKKRGESSSSTTTGVAGAGAAIEDEGLG